MPAGWRLWVVFLVVACGGGAASPDRDATGDVRVVRDGGRDVRGDGGSPHHEAGSPRDARVGTDARRLRDGAVADATLDARDAGQAEAGRSPDAADGDGGHADATPRDAVIDRGDAHGLPADGGATDGSASASLQAQLQSLGYTAQPGVFGPVDLSGCCAAGGWCSISNPTSPYFAFYVPSAPGQTATNPGMFGPPDAGPGGLSNAWRLLEGEAIVYVGPTPPEALYFGFTPYLFDRDVDGGARKTLFASLSSTTNNLTIHVVGGGSVYDAQTVIIATADRKTSDDVATALTAAGYDPASFNTLVFDASKARFGIDSGADTFSVLFRVAEFAPSTAGEGASWVSQPHGLLLRVTPAAPPPSDPLPAVVRAESTAPTENTASLRASVAALRGAILTRHRWMKPTQLTVTDTRVDPASCIAHDTDCQGDNPDTNYPHSTPDLWPARDGDLYMLYGVNHAARGKTLYSAFTLVALSHAVGVASMTSAAYAGSAAAFVPSDPNVALLYACRVARSCAGVPSGECCLAVPGTACPGGMAPGATFEFWFRTYLDPTSDTAPDPATLMPENVLKLTLP